MLAALEQRRPESAIRVWGHWTASAFGSSGSSLERPSEGASPPAAAAYVILVRSDPSSSRNSRIPGLILSSTRQQRMIRPHPFRLGRCFFYPLTVGAAEGLPPEPEVALFPQSHRHDAREGVLFVVRCGERFGNRFRLWVLPLPHFWFLSL